MKKVALFFAMAVLSATVFTSCQKEPQAAFKTDKSSYVAGETVHLTNTTTDGSSYKWTLPDGQTSTARDVDYTIDPANGNGSLVFKLEAFSKNGKKDDEASQTVSVTAATGKVSFWQSGTPSYGITEVLIETPTGVVSAFITQDYPGGIGSCDLSGTANFTLPVGTYAWGAIDNSSGTQWPATGTGTITITKDGCLKFQLY